MEKEKNKTASWLKGHVYDVAAYAGLVITIILFLITLKRMKIQNLMSIILMIKELIIIM